jgi:NAD(P)-dependent dehydrogenase (short-subunit alcohol dehydrogenase family)
VTDPAPGNAARPLEGRAALVVGASRGIGLAVARAWAAAGARLVLASRDADALEAAAAGIRDGGGEALAMAADVRRADDVEAVVAATERDLGRLDLAFNNAGINATPGLLADSSIDEFDDVVAVNLRGVYLAMRSEIPAMRRAGGGAIVNMGSVGGLTGNRGFSAYIAAKHGVTGLTRAAAVEYAADGIRVNAVAAGVTLTEMVQEWFRQDPMERDRLLARVPMARVAEVGEIADVVTWLASPASSYVTGAVIPVDGGYLAS